MPVKIIFKSIQSLKKKKKKKQKQGGRKEKENLRAKARCASGWGVSGSPRLMALGSAGGGAPTLLLVMALGGKDLSPSLSVSSHNPPRAPFPGNSG